MTTASPAAPSAVSMRGLAAAAPARAGDQDDAAWREAAKAAIRASSLDALTRSLVPGVDRLPLYDRDVAVALPAAAQQAWAARGGWDIRAAIDADQQAGLADAATAIRDAVRVAREAGAGSASWTPAHDDALATVATALAEADAAGFPVYLEVGPLASRWLSARAGHGGAVLAAPLAALASDGALPCSLDACWDDLAASLRDPRGRGLDLVSCSALPAHEAGASVTTAIAFALAQLAETARALDARGVGPDAWLGRTWLQLGVDGDALVGIAAVRAARLCLLRIQAALGADLRTGPRIACVTTRTGLSALDPWTNVLRASAEAVAAAVGGADAITCTPWDAALGVSDVGAQRLALTSQAVLAREGHLGAVADPAAGAYAIETWTQQIAEAAWVRWQVIEAEGGLAAALLAGSVQAAIATEHAATQHAVDSGAKRLVGANASPARGAQVPTRPPRAARGRDDAGAAVRCTPLPRIRWTEALERAAAANAAGASAAPADTQEADDAR